MTEKSLAHITLRRTIAVQDLVKQWEAEDVERLRGPRRPPWLAVLVLLGACASDAAPILERQEDLCAEIVDAHCQRVAECRGTSYELCVQGVDQFCPAWSPEPTCVEDIWTAECEAEMPLPCSCGSGTPNCP